MTTLTLITGNQHKADYLAKWLDMPIGHKKLDLDEIQSLDVREIAEHKVRQAFQIIHEPVLIEDVGLRFTAMGRLPGPLVKWFLEEIGNDGLCKLADSLEHRRAVAEIVYALSDGRTIHFFSHTIDGVVADKPRGDNGFGWNPIFIPEGSGKTYAEMSDEAVEPYNMRAHAIKKLQAYLLKS